MKPAFAVLAALAVPTVALLAGCAAPTYSAVSQKPATYEIECSGLLQNWRACEKKAGELCGGNGYRILTTTSDGPPTKQGGVQGWMDRILPGSKERRTITAACK